MIDAQTMTRLNQAIERCSQPELVKVAAALNILAARAGQLRDAGANHLQARQFEQLEQVLSALAIRAEYS